MLDGILKYLAMFLGVYTAIMYACFKGHRKVEKKKKKEDTKGDTLWGDLKEAVRHRKADAVNSIKTTKDILITVVIGAVIVIIDKTAAKAPIPVVWLYFAVMLIVFGGIVYLWFKYGVCGIQLLMIIFTIIPMVSLTRSVTTRLAVACLKTNAWGIFFKDDLAVVLAVLVLVYCISNRCKCNFVSYKRAAEKEAAKNTGLAIEYLAKARMWRAISVAIWPIVAVLVIIFLSTQ